MLLIRLDLPRRLRAHHKVARRRCLPIIPIILSLLPLVPFEAARLAHHESSAAIFVVDLGAGR